MLSMEWLNQAWRSIGLYHTLQHPDRQKKKGNPQGEMHRIPRYNIFLKLLAYDAMFTGEKI